MVVSNMTVTDINNSGAEIDASDGTNTDGGGNTGWNFTAPVPPTPGSAATHRPSRGSLSMGMSL